MLVFAAAVFFLIVTPGPGVLSTAGVGSAFGYKPGMRYVFGLFLGNNLVAIAVVSGLAALVLGVPYVRPILSVASVMYLTYLALKIGFSGSKIAFVAATKPPGITGGLALQAINPKAYAVNTVFFTNFEIFPENLPVELAIKFAILNAIWVPIHLIWLALGVSLRWLDLSQSTQRGINITMAVSMMLVVALAAYSARETL
jgi:threonine/homoserine/homoserine lactone efflux protein